MSWYKEANDKGFADVAKSIGMKKGKTPHEYGPCPSCKASRRSKKDPRLPIGVSENNMGWKCFACKITGDVPDLITLHLAEKKTKDLNRDEFDNLNEWLTDNSFHLHTQTKRTKRKRTISHPKNLQFQSLPTANLSSQQNHLQKKDFRWSEELPLKYKDQLLRTTEGMVVLNYLINERKISDDVIEAADLGCMWIDKGKTKEYFLTIPLKNQEGEIVNIRFRSIPPAKKSYRVCSGRPMPLYGSASLKDKNSQVLIAEGELDVLALNSYGFDTNVVSGTAGATANWPDEWLDQLEDFKQFLLWYDNDDAGKEGASKLAKKLGEYRCFLVESEFNDVGEARSSSISGEQIEDILDKNLVPFLKSNLKRVDSYADELENLIRNPKSLIGLRTGSQKLDKVLGGIAPGLWVVSGDTGHGKTTWSTWLCHEQAKMGIPVLLTSFEQRPIGTVQKLLRAQIGGDFTEVSEAERRDGLEQLGLLPLYIYDHYGELEFEDIVESLRFSVRRHDVKIALIDHLGFLTQVKSYKDDERLLIENVVRKLATIAVQDDFTIILVCHPNNMSVSQQRRVKISDLKGASAIRQDAHVALIVERKDGSADRGFPATTVYVDKVRSEFGQNGSSTTLAFDPLSCVYADIWEDTPSCQKGKTIITPEPEERQKRKRRRKRDE